MITLIMIALSLLVADAIFLDGALLINKIKAFFKESE